MHRVFSSIFRMYAVRSGSRYVAFLGPESQLSNLSPAEIQVELRIRAPGPGQPPTRIYTFGSVEHAYQFFKLQFLGLHRDAQELHQRYATEVPFHNQVSFGVMTLARDMITRARQNYEVADIAVQMWQNHHAVRVIEELVLRKLALPSYQQTRAFLLNHSDMEFLESTKHSFWGCGHRSSELERMTDSEIKQQCGCNEMGKVIKRVAIHLTDGYEHRREGVNFDYFM